MTMMTRMTRMMMMMKHLVLSANRHTGQTTIVIDVQGRMQVKREERC
jgi:hypothetical protein